MEEKLESEARCLRSLGFVFTWILGILCILASFGNGVIFFIAGLAIILGGLTLFNLICYFVGGFAGMMTDCERLANNSAEILRHIEQEKIQKNNLDIGEE